MTQKIAELQHHSRSRRWEHKLRSFKLYFWNKQYDFLNDEFRRVSILTSSIFRIFTDVVKYTTVLILFEVFRSFPPCDQRAQLEDCPPIEMKLIARI